MVQLPHVTNYLALQNFHDKDELKIGIEMRFREHAVNFYDNGMKKFVPRHNECMDNYGNCEDK